jgi:hypothetical protein
MSKPSMSRLGVALQVARAIGPQGAILRLGYELRRGSGILSSRMRSVQGWERWNLERIALGSSPRQMLASRRRGERRFLFQDAFTLRPALRILLGRSGEERVLQQAEEILLGSLPFFGSLSYATGFPPQWFRNPVTGESVDPNQPWTRMRFASPSYGDLKFFLEPSRFLFAYPLVRAYALSGEERFPQAFWSAVEDWAVHNPPMLGPLWICGQECSLRILAWSFALHAFIHSPSTTEERVAKLISMIAAHAWRTAQTLDYARSQRSNHLVSEAAGLWTAGILFPELEEARSWQELGAQLLHEAVVDQIAPDGTPRQHSFNYQRMILHQLLWFVQLARLHNIPIHQDIRERAQSAFEFLRCWVDANSGLVPNFGSDDGSLIFPLACGEYHDFRPLLQLGAAVLDRPGLKPGPWNEAALWFGAEPAPDLNLHNQTHQTACPSASTGYFRLGDANSWALIRAGRCTSRPFQADQLHMDIWWNGLNLVRDAGTYLYNGPTPWDNGLARTAVHSTVTVDHADQMVRAGRFLWVNWAQASGQASSSNGLIADRFEGEHAGYRRFGVIHRRFVQWLHGGGWLIVDDLEADDPPPDDPEADDLAWNGEHAFCLHWLCPDLPFEFADSPFRMMMNSDQSRFSWNIFSSHPGDARIIRSGKLASGFAGAAFEHPAADLLGWEASTYGDLRPAISIVHQCRSRLPLRFVTALLTGEQTWVEERNREIIVFCRAQGENDSSKPEELESARVTLVPGTPIKATNSQPSMILSFA